MPGCGCARAWVYQGAGVQGAGVQGHGCDRARVCKELVCQGVCVTAQVCKDLDLTGCRVCMAWM